MQTEGQDEAVPCKPCRQQACFTTVPVTWLGQSSALGTESTFADSMNLRGVSVRGTGPGRLGEARRAPEPSRDPSLGPDSSLSSDHGSDLFPTGQGEPWGPAPLRLCLGDPFPSLGLRAQSVPGEQPHPDVAALRSTVWRWGGARGPGREHPVL